MCKPQLVRKVYARACIPQTLPDVISADRRIAPARGRDMNPFAYALRYDLMSSRLSVISSWVRSAAAFAS